MNFPTLTDTYSTLRDGLKAAAPLSHGRPMPWLGLGVYQISRDADLVEAVHSALALGYRSIDTAAIYHNERGVGEAIRSGGVPREELFITTKVWNDEMRADRVEAALTDSLERLQLDYVDLYLLHWPIKGKIIASWKALEKLQRSGRVRAIGVSNYMIPHLEELLPVAEIVPAVNQIEFHPYLQSTSLVDYCRTKGIQVEAWSPLMQGGAILKDRILAGIAAGHGRTVAQIILRWNVQSGVVTIPKSAKPRRIEENARVFDFALTHQEMSAIASLDRNVRVGPDPLDFNF